MPIRILAISLFLVPRPRCSASSTKATSPDACRALDCNDPGLHDRVLVRSSDSVTLTPVSWELDARFVDALDQPLSDHDAVGITIEWSAL